MRDFRLRPLPRHAWTLAALLVVALAAALRLPGLHWWMPDAQHPGYSGHPDEAATLAYAHWMAQGRMMPMQFIYGGTLYLSLLNAFYYYGNLLGAKLGGVNELANALLVGRTVFTVCSLLTVALTWRIGTRLFGRTSGLLAALFLALSPAHAFLAQSIRPDEVCTLMGLLLVWMGVVVLHGQPPRDHLHFAATGLLVGLAVAMRFPFVVFGAAPLAAWLARERGAGWWRNLKALLRWRLPLLAVVAALTYALASPCSLLYPGLLKAGLEVQKNYQTGSFADAVGRGPGIYQYGWLTLQQALGVPLHLLALAGVLLAAVRPTAARLVILAPAIAYFIPITLVSWVVVRYTVPLLPLLALLAADALSSFAADAPARQRFAAATAAAIVAWTLCGDIAFARLQAGRNSRQLATDWIEANIPKGASIVEVQQYIPDVFLNPVIPAGYRHFEFMLGGGTDELLLDDSADHDYIVINSDSYRNMDRLGPRNLQPGAPALQRILDGGHYQIAVQIAPPVRLLGIDYSAWFTSQDFNIINPGERIYRYVATPARSG